MEVKLLSPVLLRSLARHACPALVITVTSDGNLRVGIVNTSRPSTRQVHTGNLHPVDSRSAVVLGVRESYNGFDNSLNAKSVAFAEVVPVIRPPL